MAALINITAGPKGVNMLAGPVATVLAGESIDAAEVSETEAADLVAVGWFTVSDAPETEAAPADDGAPVKGKAKVAPAE